MRCKRLAVGLLAGLTVLASGGKGLASVELVAFDRSLIGGAMECCDISVIAKLDGRAVALLGRGEFEKLLAVDASAQLLESSADVDRLWVAGSRESTPGLPGMLLRTRNFQLLSRTFDEAVDLMREGFRLSKCRSASLPPDPVFYVPPKIAVPRLILDDIDSLMALVSADSVRSYIQRLQDFQTRYTCTDSFWMAGDWIAGRFQSWGYDDVTYEQFEVTGWCDSRNVIATRNGETYPDRIIVLGGHYDAVVYDGGDPNVFAPGADDNGTGAAFTMEIARVLSGTPFRKTVRFITFGAEEQGLWGSWNHAMGCLDRGDNIELMINADMIGNLEDGYLNFGIMCNEGGYPYGRALGELAEESTDLIPEIEVGEFGGSDHYPFDQCGFRTVYSEESDFSPNYHRQTDLVENLDMDYAADIVRINLGLLLVALATPTPVTGLEAFNAGDGQTVYLQWEQSSDDDVIGYEVYVGTTEDGVAVYDTSYVLADTVYNLDEEVPCYFGVAALTSDGGRSLIEDFVQLTPRSIPSTPESLAVIPQLGSLRVEWSGITEMDFDYYQVYRRVGDDGSYVQHDRVYEGQHFTDQNLQSNVRYYYFVTQVDTTGLESDPSPADYAKIFSFDCGILLVDETRDFSGGQGMPTDAEQDSFYQFISDGYDVEFHDISSDGILRINDLGAYSTIAWMDDDATSQYIAEVDDALARYLDMGGNLLFVGWRSLVDYGLGRPLEFRTGTFPFDYLLINEVNSPVGPDFSGASGEDGWPDLNVLPERVLPPWEGLLLGVDVMAVNQGAIPIYEYVSASGDTLFDGKPAGIIVSDQEPHVVYLTFPLYTMGDVAAREVFVRAMDLLGEQSTATSDYVNSESVPAAFLAQNYPNPFNGETRIRFVLTRKSDIRVAVYNILGQEVSVLADGEYPAGIHYVIWDGEALPSGVYFYRLILDTGALSRRMTLVR